MAMYYCEMCQEFRDDDYSPACEYPHDKTKLICDECEIALEEFHTIMDFMQGMTDCLTGKPHMDKGEAYTNGYARQYEIEQRESNHGK